MEIQEIKIDGVVYVSAKSCVCKDCVFEGKGCFSTAGSFIIKVCELFDGHALKVKEN